MMIGRCGSAVPSFVVSSGRDKLFFASAKMRCAPSFGREAPVYCFGLGPLVPRISVRLIKGETDALKGTDHETLRNN